ncbi:unnamed protein product [Toxocara canis]|uniref:Uncharacterized protein n=1 Tax=Toxocara canis TaxID=6265 RepID=A0A3P7FM92_TOXCA|nr:unnamed protein product [Toxocara canis]
MSTLRTLQVDRFVDVVVCGDDAGAVPKPHPHNALSICRELDVDPQAALFRSYDSFCFPLRQCGLLQAAMVVGDTLADIGMGRMANVGCTVGVLSGVCGTDQLLPHAHHIVSFPFDLQHWDLRAAFQGMVRSFCERRYGCVSLFLLVRLYQPGND